MPIVDKDERREFEASLRKGGMHVVRAGGRPELIGEREPSNR